MFEHPSVYTYEYCPDDKRVINVGPGTKWFDAASLLTNERDVVYQDFLRGLYRVEEEIYKLRDTSLLTSQSARHQAHLLLRLARMSAVSLRVWMEGMDVNAIPSGNDAMYGVWRK